MYIDVGISIHIQRRVETVAHTHTKYIQMDRL